MTALRKLSALLSAPSSFDLEDKVVIVTGGSRGLGLELARLFVKARSRVAICARTHLDVSAALAELRALDSLASGPSQLAGDGLVERIMADAVDVSDRESVSSFVESVLERWGRIDVLVNNAGIMLAGPLPQMTRYDFERAMETHFWGPFNMIEAVLPSMRATGAGRIVNISSVGGKIAVPHLVPYCASKFALTGFSAGLRTELAPENIFVTTVHPGLMRTGSPMNVSFKGKHRLEYMWFALSDSLPFLSMSATRAAEQIVRATTRGRADVVLSLPAKLGALVNAVAPNLISRVMIVADELLPKSPQTLTGAKFGFESESVVVPSWLTHFTREAEKRNNERTHRRALLRQAARATDTA